MIKKVRGKLDDGKLTEEDSTAIARDWMAVADIDGSGTIDFEEFSTFASKLECKLSEDEVKKIFVDSDKNSNGELDLEEFGLSFHQIVQNI